MMTPITRNDELAQAGMSHIEEVQRLKAEIWAEDYLPDELASLSKSKRQAALRALPLIVAEGDSWFDYPVGLDVLDQLRRLYGYEIERHGKAGDTLENMTYGTEINRRFQRRSPQLEEVVKSVQKLRPKVVLFSAGGNDVAGDELIHYLQHASSAASKGGKVWLRADAWTSALAQMEACIRYFAAAIRKANPDSHIVMHGYANPVPDGRAVINAPLGFKFFGPWLRPAFAMKGYERWETTEPFAAKLLGDYNALLAKIAKSSGSWFHYVDTRPAVARNQWANELHPTNAGFEAVARKIHNDVLRHL